MITFPELSRGVRLGGISETKATDPTIRSDFESGAVMTRARFTKIPEAWEVTYKFLTASDKAALKAFENEAGVGAKIFNWVNPDPNDGKVYECRLAAPIVYRSEARQPELYEVVLKIVEA